MINEMDVLNIDKERNSGTPHPRQPSPATDRDEEQPEPIPSAFRPYLDDPE